MQPKLSLLTQKPPPPTRCGPTWWEFRWQWMLARDGIFRSVTRQRLGQQLPLKQVIDALKEPLTNPKIQKIGHNLKYDFVMLVRNGLRPTPLTFDTMIAEWLTNPTSHNLGLKNLAWVRLDFRMTEITELIGTR